MDQKYNISPSLSSSPGLLLLCGLLQQIVLITFAISQIDGRDSKISPELRTYSKFEDELRAIRNRSPGSSRNPIDSTGTDSVNKFLSKESDSEEIESIEDEPHSTPSTGRLEQTKDDNQALLPDSSESSEYKPVNETTNSKIDSNSITNSETNSKTNNNTNPINQTTTSGNHSDGVSDEDRSNGSHHFNETLTSNETTVSTTPSMVGTSDQPLSVSTSSNLVTEAERFERTTTMAGDHFGLSESTESSSLTTTQSFDQTNSSSRAISSTAGPIGETNNETTTMSSFAQITDSNLNLTDKSNDSSRFTHKPCYTFDELELMVSRCHFLLVNLYIDYYWPVY